MKTQRNWPPLSALLLIGVMASVVVAQEPAVVLSGTELTRVVPTSFYFEGQSAPTQMRNSAAARFGQKRYVIAGLVDTSGYSDRKSTRLNSSNVSESRMPS